MKFQILRRTGALVLALVLALTLTMPVWAVEGDEVDVPVESVTLTPATLTLEERKTATLTATVTPAGATDKTVTWTSSDTTVATVSNGVVTAVKAGAATITATAGGKSATCEVKVTESFSFQFSTSGDIVRNYTQSDTWELATVLTGVDNPNNAEITWAVSRKSPSDKTTLPTLNGESKETVVGGTTVTIGNQGAGDFTVSATYGGNTIYKNVTISGIVLTSTREMDEDGALTMYLNDSMALSVKAYGLADTKDSVIWMSSDGSVLSVMNGQLTSYSKLGKAIVTATKGNYSDDCTIKVVEDESIIAGPYSGVSVSRPLNIGEVVYTRLNDICKAKTELYGEYADKDAKIGYDLKYINNLKVSTSQGILLYNYISEENPGRGIAATDQFAKTTGGTTYYSLDKLYFVPKSGFIGTAEITFNAVAANNRNFSGTIKVNVGMGSTGADGEGGEDGGDYTYQISYRARAGEPAWFLPSDFNAFCRSATGRSYNSITFSLPKSSEGTLYYNYMAGSGTPVTSTAKFTPSGVYTLDNVCFVPNAAYDSNEPVIISFHAVDSAGDTANGTVEVEVIPVDVSSDPANVLVFGEKGRPVTLQSELFNDACRNTIKDTLSFVIFKLPDPKEGVLYYNYQSNGSYDSRVTASTRCYYSGVPGISGVTFVPSSGATGRIAISYTGYGSGGTSYAGTLYIGLDEANSSTIRYSVEKYGSVTFNASDFYNAGLYQKGIGVDYVTFTDVPDTDLGVLRYDYRSSSRPGSVVSSGNYYVSPSGGQRGLNLLSFHGSGLTGTVTIDYTAYCGTGRDRQTFTGEVVIQVGAIAAADVNVSCSAGGQVGLSSYSLSSACDPVMSESLSYIEITGVPSSEEGHLYLNYYGYGTGTAVKPGGRFYCAGSPGIDWLTFVPNASFTGKTEITYIGYSGDGQERVSGRVVVNVTNSGTSAFNDMGGYEWAVDAVEYLRQNGTVKGTGHGGYNPGGTISRGDFTLMLVRGYGFTAGGSASFHDVPADSYYADAIRTASLLGIVNGYNGYFHPQDPLTRQDAMVIIFNAINASGKTITNGLAADFSPYHDAGEIAPYARKAMGGLILMGVVKGNGSGYLQPRNQLTRAEAAVLLHAIMTL